MIPVIAVAGLSGSGKTTLIEKLITELGRRGHRVASIKHAHEVQFEPDKDSERHLAAGSQATLTVTPQRVVMVKPADSQASLTDMAEALGSGYDIILAEGFKGSDMPKIVTQRDCYRLPLDGLKQVVAVVSDEPMSGIRRFSFEDTTGLADFIETDFIKPHDERLSLWINGKPVSLIAFPRRMISRLMLGMASSLKGVKDIKSLQLWLRAGGSGGRQIPPQITGKEAIASGQ
jgi:molybdopterin-guanine dinucleotide biosynthesis protein B